VGAEIVKLFYGGPAVPVSGILETALAVADPACSPQLPAGPEAGGKARRSST